MVQMRAGFLLKTSSMASGASGAAQRPHLNCLVQRKKRRKERGGDIDQRESFVGAAVALCTSAEGTTRGLSGGVRLCVPQSVS